ncbi:hypothetical protein AUJ17_05595 [Candidatus Micrarchaeota archaeon CG1_02_47_40]|nr:MAG: hypothetical protein AUJ17_05595 [Candidatus Micrarchaeota archaeon CG1_02_47_40]
MILLTGATGRLGGAVLEKLVKGKKKVRVLVRDKEKMGGLAKGVEIAEGDICKMESLKGAFEGVDSVIHCAGSVNFADEEEMMRINAEGTGNVLQACAESGAKIKRFIHCSSITVYGKNIEGREIGEEEPAHPDSIYAKSKYEAEEECKKFAEKFPITILRLGVIYGKGFEAGYGEVLERIRKGEMKVIGRGDNVVPLVHVEDAADAIVKALEGKERKEKKGKEAGGGGCRIYNIVGEKKTQRELYEISAEALGVSAPRGSVSVFLARMIANLSGKRELLEYMNILSSDRQFSVKKAEEELKWKAKIGLGKGIKGVVEHL